jgi:branched-chain amino acid transport system ATP-binding protein
MNQVRKAILETRNLTKSFGGLRALQDISVSVYEGEFVGLIGPNGAGKSTLLNSIVGIVRPTSGRIFLGGQDVTGRKPHQLAERGIAKTFQLVTLFEESTVLENILVACNMKFAMTFWASVFDTSKNKRKNSQMLDKALEVLQLVGIEELRDEIASTMSHGHRKLLQLAMTLVLSPRVLLLDEPAAGMSGVEIKFMMNLVKEEQHNGVGVILIEHNMSVIQNYCDKVIVLNYGQKIAEGTPEEISTNDDVIEAYLGGVEGAV